VAQSVAEKVLIIGSGAREHALARALLEGSPTRVVVVAPGNGGIGGDRLRRRDVDPLRGDAVVALAREESAELVVIGPEAPLGAGVADDLRSAGFIVFGPSRAAARLETDKAFLKELAKKAGIRTAPFVVVRSMEDAERAIEARGAPIVVKASGLCAGKGVVVAETKDEALAAARSMLVDQIFGEAGMTVVLEDKIVGREVSVHAICDGERFFLLPPARDHKRALDGDRGPNTGGMGVICPAGDVSEGLMSRIAGEVVERTLVAMKEEGSPFRGVLFAGMMIDEAGEPWLLEHNVRFGDPECEAMMELVESDVGAMLLDAARGALDASTVQLAKGRHAAVVVLCAAGYPEKPRSGDAISGIERAESIGARVHHAGTKRTGDGLFTAGGRVLAVTCAGPTMEAARAKAYAACEAIHFEGMHYRRDIGLTVAR